MTLSELSKESSVNPCFPVSKLPKSAENDKLPILIIPFVMIGAMTFSIFLEIVLTDVEIELARLPAVLILSPITLTVGGGHFPSPALFRLLFVFVGLASFPIMTTAIAFAWRLRSRMSYATMFLVIAFFYFGVVHKHLAVLSV